MKVQFGAGTDIYTRGSEEGPRQPLVRGDVSDFCGHVDESTNHRRDPVEAQQSEAERQKR